MNGNRDSLTQSANHWLHTTTRKPDFGRKHLKPACAILQNRLLWPASATVPLVLLMFDC